MDEFIKLLDPGLDYIGHEMIGDTIVIRVASNKEQVVCPYCGCASSKQGMKRGAIAKEVGISYSTVKRYQTPGFTPVHGKYNTTAGSKIKPYAEQIKQMLKENI
ncbi:helix-turn-helix domain-containing protein [Hungatella hathewayi]|uniref:helix-turn-helix domain-containing protein n=1 Tax=Hungatella hathewayi TaxID=154046 RepID=UPI00356AE837